MEQTKTYRKLMGGRDAELEIASYIEKEEGGECSKKKKMGTG